MRYVLGFCALAALLLGVATATTYGQVSTLPGANACYLRLYTELPDTAQVVTIGSSRVRRAIEPHVMTEKLGRPDGAVVNLGHPVMSLPYDLNLLERLTDDHVPEVLIFGLVPRSEALRRAERAIDPRNNARFDFALTSGTIKQVYLLGSPWRAQAELIFAATDNPVIAAWDATRLYAERLRQFIPAVLTRAVLLRPLSTEGYNPERHYDCMLNNWIEPTDRKQNVPSKERELKAAYRETFSSFEDPDPLGYLTEATRKLEHVVIERLIALAREGGAYPAFMYVPGINVPIAQDLATSFEARFGAPLWIPSEALRAQMEAGGYFDNSHLNNAGRVLFSTWLAERVEPHLSQNSQ